MKDHSPRRRMKALPQPKKEKEKANSDVCRRPMTDEEHERLGPSVPKERDFMAWSPTRRKEVGD